VIYLDTLTKFGMKSVKTRRRAPTRSVSPAMALATSPATRTVSEHVKRRPGLAWMNPCSEPPSISSRAQGPVHNVVDDMAWRGVQRHSMWWMTWRAPAQYVVDDVASTGTLCGG